MAVSPHAPEHELRLFEDTLIAGGRFTFGGEAASWVIHVVHGAVTLNGQEYQDNTACLGHGVATLEAGGAGVTVWRFELARLGVPPLRADAEAGRSVPKLTHLVHLPAGDLLMRNDSVAFPPAGCAYRHTHQGPGIRCLIEGGIRIDTEGTSTSYGPGGAWFESGPEPVFAQAALDRPSRFIRVMVLPAELLGKSSIRYVDPADQDKPKVQTYKSYAEGLIAP
jgi:hypothetical protein